jgi:uncharacterized protein
MALILNLRLLSQETLFLQGELSPAELDFGLRDDLLQIQSPVEYDLTAEMVDEAILVRGSLSAELDCVCVRCLKPFARPLDLPEITLHLPLTGEEAVTIDNDNVDLTPFLREDMILEFPQHPLCQPDCTGLKKVNKNQAPVAGDKPEAAASAWAELNKLKL